MSGSSGNHQLLASHQSGESQKMSEGEHAALQRQARIIKHLLSELVTEIPSLHENYKFFNDSFVFHDKDYLKYLSKEANEVKGLLSVYKIRF